MLKRWIKILLKVLLTLFVLLFVFLLFERVRGQISLARYKRELAAKGEKLTFGELITPVPQGENGAPEVFEAIKQLKEGVVLPANYPPPMRIMPSGRAIVGFRESEWVNDKVTNHWNQLAAELKTNEATLTRIRLALEKPVLNNKLDYSHGYKLRLDYLIPVKSLTYWLGASTELALHERKPHEAADNLFAEIRLPRLLHEDYIFVSELTGIAIASITKSATWEALQADGWTDQDLALLQQAWQAEDFMTAMERGLEGERASGETSYEQFRRSNTDTAQTIEWLGVFYVSEEESKRTHFIDILQKEIGCRIWRFAWLDQDERRALGDMQRLIEIARTAAKEKSYGAILPSLDGLNKETLNKNLYDYLRFPLASWPGALSSIVKRAMRAETERSITICAIALKRYSLRHGKAPASLDALVPEFLSSVPTDYMDSKPMKYHLNSDGSFTLYSVGIDGKDDGGDASLPPEKKASQNLWDRRDFIWPSPALPEEIEAYREKAARN
jgi:hypothetical protein